MIKKYQYFVLFFIMMLPQLSCWADQSFERCGSEYIEMFNKNALNMMDLYEGEDSLLNYDRHLRHYSGNHVAASFSYLYTVVVTPIAIPVLGVMSITKNRIDSKYDFIGKAIVDPESYAAEPGMKALYNQVEDEVQITESQFFNFFLNHYNRARLCGAKKGIVLSERGKDMIGSDNFMAFMKEVHRTPQWEHFWEDERNFEMGYKYGPYEIDEIKSQLIYDLIQAGYNRID